MKLFQVCGRFPLRLVSEADGGGRPESCSFSCRPHIHILNGFLWHLGIFMAPFDSMGFAADGGGRCWWGGGVSSDGGRATATLQNSSLRPFGRLNFTRLIWSLLIIVGLIIHEFGSFLCLFRLFLMEWDFAQVSVKWNPDFHLKRGAVKLTKLISGKCFMLKCCR